MKEIFLLFSLIITIEGLAQNPNRNFTLEGKLQGCDTGKIVLVYSNASRKIIRDTTLLKKGTFKFTGAVNGPTRAFIIGKKEIIDFESVNSVTIFLEPGNLFINLVYGDFQHAKMTGSFTQKENEELNRMIDSIDAKYKNPLGQLIAAKYAYRNANNKEEKERALQEQNKIGKTLEPLHSEITHADVSFVLSHPDSYVSPYIFYTPANVLPVDSAIAIFKKLSPRIRNSTSGIYMANLLRKREQNTIAKAAYNFSAKDVNGEDVSLSQFRGKFVLLDFWASWCEPCIAGFPATKKLYDTYHSQGFEILAISIDRDSSSWCNAVKKQKINNWYNVLVNKDIGDNYPNVTNPIPSAILVSPKGEIVWNSGQSEKLEDVLRELIK